MTNTARRFCSWRGLWLAACLWGAAVGTADAQGERVQACKLPVLTLAEAAELLRLDASVLERFATSGEVPGRRIGADWRFGCAALMAWLNGAVTTKDMADLTARGIPSNQADAPPRSSSPSASGSQAEPIGDAPKEQTAEDVFLRGQRVLLAPGSVAVDVGQFFARRDDLVLTTNGGSVGLATLEQRALSTILVGRLGLFNETELFALTSYSRQHSRQFIDRSTLGSTVRAAFGATTVGIRRTLLRESVGRPGMIVTFAGQIPYDEVPTAVGTGVVFVKSVDPVVLFANANYFHAFRKESGDVAARFRAADTVDLSMGYGLGLNDTVAISMAFSGSFARTTTMDGTTSRLPSAFSARFGFTASLAPGLFIEPSISVGLTGPGDAVAYGVTLPYAF